MSDLSIGQSSTFERPGIYLVRHAQPTSHIHMNTEEKSRPDAYNYGFFLSGDSPAGVTKGGYEDSAMYGKVLKRTLPLSRHIAVTTSSTNRTYRTAVAFAEGYSSPLPPIIPIPDLMEALFLESRPKTNSDWTEESLAEFKHRRTRVKEERYGDRLRIVESVEAFEKRVCQGFVQMLFLGKTLLEYQANPQASPLRRSGPAQAKILENSTLICFTHGGVIQTIMKALFNENIERPPYLGTYFIPWENALYVALSKISFPPSHPQYIAYSTSFEKVWKALRKNRYEFEAKQQANRK